MVDTHSFIVRRSGKMQERYYIDYTGYYKVTDISKQVNVDPLKISDLYISNGGILDPENDVYFFGDPLRAKKTIREILALSPERGRSVMLTEAEIEYIRKALINDGSGNIGIDNRTKDSIFRKLND
jgi:hypothetical protein